jgi:nitrogen regulatory protein PII
MDQEIILVVFNASIEEEVMEALHGAGLKCYTKFVNVQGAGTCSEPRLDSHIWPGTNIMLLVTVKTEQTPAILQAVRSMKDVHREEGVSAFVIPISDRV